MPIILTREERSYPFDMQSQFAFGAWTCKRDVFKHNMDKTKKVIGSSLMQNISDIMKTDVITIRDDTSVIDVIKVLGEHNITGAPVVDAQNNLVGIVSEKDVMSLAYKLTSGNLGQCSRSKKISDVMTREIVTFRPDDNIADVCQCFMYRSIRRVPVVEDGKVVGLVSRRDIIHAALHMLEQTV